MTDEQTTPRDKADLLRHIDQARSELQDLIGQTDEARLTAPGAGGWSIKDHLAHLAAWERSLTALLHGRPRHAALQVDEATYREAGFDGINAIIHARERGRPLPAVLADFHDAHREVLAALAGLTDDDLFTPYSHYQPNEPGRRGDEPIIGWIVGNTYEHYEEHLATIRSLVSR